MIVVWSFDLTLQAYLQTDFCERGIKTAKAIPFRVDCCVYEYFVGLQRSTFFRLFVRSITQCIWKSNCSHPLPSLLLSRSIRDIHTSADNITSMCSFFVSRCDFTFLIIFCCRIDCIDSCTNVTIHMTSIGTYYIVLYNNSKNRMTIIENGCKREMIKMNRQPTVFVQCTAYAPKWSSQKQKTKIQRERKKILALGQ